MTFWTICPKIYWVIDMADFEEMYYELFRATEKAINILIEVQNKCEDMFINAPECKISTFPDKNTKNNKKF